MDAKKLAQLGDDLFGKKRTLNLLHQEIADNFYFERADFAYQRYLGIDMGAHALTSYPTMMRRDLGNALGTMLRPTETPWFHMATIDPTRETNDARRWLEWAEGMQRRAMYDRASLFTRATKEGDHDFAAFGQCAITVELNRHANGLLYRCWHLRDMAWQENADGKIGAVFRKWKPTAQTLVQTFKKGLHPSIIEANEKTPFQEFNLYHMVVEAEMYDGDARGRAFWSIYYDIDHGQEVEATPMHSRMYVIPRWQTVSGSQYAFSPATVCALPDGRLLQAMTRTILEAGEKAVYPPMIATEYAVRSDVALFAGGITWVDREYDERMGEPLRPLPQDLRGFPHSREFLQDLREQLNALFFLNKLSMPERAPEMTAYEVGQRIQQYIRDAMPIFEPMEAEYNGALCEESFNLLMRHGAFGPLDRMPRELRGVEVQFRFESPLHEAQDAMKVQKLIEAKQAIGLMLDVDPSVKYVLDANYSVRDALLGARVPARWQRPQEEAQAMQENDQRMQAVAAALSAAQQGSTVAANLASAQSDMASAGVQ